jgi:hypothetical protein
MSAHLHVHFESKVQTENGETLFIALDKPTSNPRRQFTKLLTIGEREEGEVEVELYYDEHWISILRATQECLPLDHKYDAN